MRKLKDSRHMSVIVTNEVFSFLEKIADEKDWSTSQALRFVVKDYADNYATEQRKAG